MDSTSPVPGATPTTVGAAPWYTSQVQIAQVTALISGVVAFAPGAAAKVGITSPADVSSAVQYTFAAIGIAATIWGVIMRALSAIQPLVWSKKAAEVHPATVAIVQTQTAMKAANIPTAGVTQAAIEAKQDTTK